MSFLRKLHTDEFDVTVISPRNYFLFTPLLASTTSGLLQLRSIVEPIRKYCVRAGRQEVKFLEVEATSIDPITQKVSCEDISTIKGTVSKFDVYYDYLVVSVGAETATFNIPGVEKYANYMKTTQDSRNLRDRVIDCFETAMIPGQPQKEIDRLMHFVVVGGGPSGVEYTAELHDFVKNDLKKVFPQVASRFKISLVEALPNILPMFDPALIDYTQKKFTETREIEILTNNSVTNVDSRSLTLKQKGSNETIDVDYGILVWVTGNSPRKIVSNLINDLGPKHQPMRRGLMTDEYLRVVGTENMFSLGDCSIRGNLPATAQVASQEGHYLGRLFNKLSQQLYKQKLEQEQEKKLSDSLDVEKKFEFHSFGSFAYIGDHQAIADFGPERSKQKGFSTWLLWRSVYFSKLLSLRNRISVVSGWIGASTFGRDISRAD